MMIAPSASNTDADVQRSSNNRRPSWSGALLMLGARLGFAVAVQAIVAWVFFLRWLSVFRTRSRGLLIPKREMQCSTVSSVHPAKPPNTVNPVLAHPAVSHLIVCS